MTNPKKQNLYTLANHPLTNKPCVNFSNFEFSAIWIAFSRFSGLRLFGSASSTPIGPECHNAVFGHQIALRGQLFRPADGAEPISGRGVLQLGLWGRIFFFQKKKFSENSSTIVSLIFFTRAYSNLFCFQKSTQHFPKPIICGFFSESRTMK